MTMTTLHDRPLSQRPPPTPLAYLHAASFNAFFQLGMLVLHVLQLGTLPFRLHPVTLSLYNRLAIAAKDLFGLLLVFITMFWAPTSFRITVDENDDELDLRKIVQRNDNGRVIGLDLPDRMVLIANHQVRHIRTDTIYHLTCLSFSPGLL